MDLRRQRTYRVYKTEDWPATPKEERHWSVELRGRHGDVYLYGGDTLVAHTTGNVIANRLLGLDCTEAHQDCRPTELTATFHKDNLPQVAKLLRLRKRRVLSEKQLAVLNRARIAAHKLNAHTQCLHVEIPTAVRRKMVLKLRSLEIESSLDSSGL